MKATKRLVKINNNFYFPLTKDIQEYLNIDKDSLEVMWQDDESKHGRFISFWKKTEETEK